MDPRVEISGISNGVAKDGDRSSGALSAWTQNPGSLLQRRCLRNEEALQIEGSGSHGWDLAVCRGIGADGDENRKRKI